MYDRIKSHDCASFLGPEFLTALDAFAYPLIKKGAPSLFNSLKKLYDQSHEKMLLCERYFLSLLERAEMMECKSKSVSERDDSDPYAWVLYYLALHYDRAGQPTLASKYLDEAIDRHGSVVEFHMSRGRILKHAGDLKGAQECMVHACQLDLSDRFSNSKCTKYLLRSDQVLEAQKRISLFLKGEFPQKLQDLFDMQCLWYESELGESYMRTKQYGRALKLFHVAAKHFEDVLDDQFDFHNYCLRKMTICHYLNLLRFEDRLYTLPYYRRVAMNAIRCYLDLHDDPSLSMNNLNSALEFLSIEDKKKMIHKLKKAEAKQVNHVAAVDESEAIDEKKKEDADPDGESYLKRGNYLEQAAPFVNLLLSANPKHVDTLALCTLYYMRKGKWLLALKCLLSARSIDDMNSGVIHATAYTLSLAESMRDENELIHDLLCQAKASLSKSFSDMLAVVHVKSLTLPQALSIAQSHVMVAGNRSAATTLLLEQFDYEAAWNSHSFSHTVSL